MKTEIAWLINKWNLPDGAVEAVKALLASHAEGSTACRVESSITDWGRAAALADGDNTTPLVLVNHAGSDYLQTRWFFEAEKKIAVRIAHLHAAPLESFPHEKLVSYFPESGKQRDAAVMALSRKFSVITGGPGTGKTYTLARILAVLLQGGHEPKFIQLAAPTGKAADRMREAIKVSSNGLAADLRLKLEDAATSSKTIHSLLGHHPGRNAFKFHAGRPLPCKVLIVDECSMVDTLLWQALLEALPADCKLILLGDPNQLESVGRGSVFSCIANSPKLKDARTHLTHSHRFSERPAISELSRAIEEKNAESALGILQENTGPACEKGLFWQPTTKLSEVFKVMPQGVLQAIKEAAYAETAESALQALGKVRILTAHRAKVSGARSIEEFLEPILAGRRIVNRPVIVDRNDPETGLRNGEVGVIHSRSGAPRLVFFENRKDGIALSKIPDHSPAWATTIHRSQGSEYDNVVVLLPSDPDSPLATRELLYTAITRAKKNLFVFGPEKVIEKAILHSAQRTTLLPWHLDRQLKAPAAM